MDILKYIGHTIRYSNFDITVPGIETIRYTWHSIVCGSNFVHTDYGARVNHQYIENAIKNSLEIDEESVADIYRIVGIIEYKYRRLGYLQLKSVLPIEHNNTTTIFNMKHYRIGNAIYIAPKVGNEYYSMISSGVFENGKFTLHCVGHSLPILAESIVDTTGASLNQLKEYTIYACEEVHKIIFEDIQFAPIQPKSARNDVALSTRIN